MDGHGGVTKTLATPGITIAVTGKNTSSDDQVFAAHGYTTIYKGSVDGKQDNGQRGNATFFNFQISQNHATQSPLESKLEDFVG